MSIIELKPDDGRNVVTAQSRLDAVWWSEECSSSANNDEPARMRYQPFLLVF